MKKVDVYFLALAGLMLLTGVSIGMHMAMSKDYVLTPVHAHANLVGWASMALFGLTYRSYPKLKNGLLAKIHFALAAPAALLMPYGIYRAVILQDERVAIVASLLWIGAVLTFLAQLVKLLRAPAD